MNKLLSLSLLCVLFFGCSSKNGTFETKKYFEEATLFLNHIETNKAYLVDSKPFEFENYNCIDQIKNDTITFSKGEIIELEKQIKAPRIKKWSNSLLKHGKLVEHDTIKNIFSDFKTKHWPYFRKNYGTSFNTYSNPIFLRNYTLCLFYSSNSCGGLCGEGYIKLYKKTNGKWEPAKTYCYWIS